MLMDQTRIVVPVAMRNTLLEREHMSHIGETRTVDGGSLPRLLEAHPEPEKGAAQAGTGVCGQAHAERRHKFLPEEGGTLLFMDHFSGLPMFKRMTRTTAEHLIKQIKNCFSTF